MSAVKLTPAQRKLINLLRDGWQLSHGQGAFTTRAWIQKGTIGGGGERQKVSRNMTDRLLKMGMLRKVDRKELHFFVYEAIPEGEENCVS